MWQTRLSLGGDTPLWGGAWEVAEIPVSGLVMRAQEALDISMGHSGYYYTSYEIPFPLVFESKTFQSWGDVTNYYSQQSTRNVIKCAASYDGGPDNICISQKVSGYPYISIYLMTNVSGSTITIPAFTLYVFAKLR